MFHYESWKLIHFGVKRSKVKARVAKTLPALVFAVLWVLGFFS